MPGVESTKLGVMKALIADWSRGDVEGALSHMTDDIVWHYAAGVAPPSRGRQRLGPSSKISNHKSLLWIGGFLILQRMEIAFSSKAWTNTKRRQAP